MVNLNLYKTFCCVAKELNISKASEILYTSQPAVSFSIKELERELNQKLFIRKSKGVELTVFGQILYNKIKNMMDQFEQIESIADKFSKAQEGVLRIGTSSSNMNQIIFDYLSIFAKEYPNIHIVTKKESNKRLIEQLENNDLDIIFVDKDERTKKFQFVKQYDVEYKLIGDKKYKQKFDGDLIDFNEFPVNDLMLPCENNNSRITIKSYFENKGVSINAKYEFDNYILLYEFVKKGFGMAFVNVEYYKSAIENQEVFVIYPNISIFARNIVAIINNNSNNIALKKLVEIIKK